MTDAVPDTDEPPISLSDPSDLLAGYLDYYRDALLRKLDGLAEADLRASRLPSGWTPLQLVKHLTWVERRWLGWGFAAEATPNPWHDQGADGRWEVPASETTAQVFAAFAEQRTRSRQIVLGVPLAQRAKTGGRFETEAEAPTLGWILFHVLQEYARHVGQLDVARELIDGAVGE
jgi:uncharacterized damage-inducible protein DinB